MMMIYEILTDNYSGKEKVQVNTCALSRQTTNFLRFCLRSVGCLCFAVRQTQTEDIRPMQR